MTLQVGIVGAGYIARSRHVPAFRDNDDVAVTHVYDTDRTAAESLATDYGLSVVDAPSDLYAAADIVSVCTPPWTHESITTDALGAGCHVYCEKPMAMSPPEARSMIDAADDANRTLGVVHNFLDLSSVHRARTVISNNDLGSVTRTHGFLLKETERKKYRETDAWDPYTMLFWDEAPHLVYLTREFLGEFELESASVREANGDDFPYDAIRFSVARPDGGFGNVTMLYDTAVTEWWLVVVCERGFLLIDIFRDLLLWYGAETDHTAIRVLRTLLRTIRLLTTGGVTAGLRFLRDRFVDGYAIPNAGFSVQVDEYVDAVRTGTEPPVTGADGLETITTMDRVASRAGMYRHGSE